MQKTTCIVSGLALTATIALSALAQTPAAKLATHNVAPAKSALAQTAKPAKHAKTSAAPKSDADIQSCIQSKLAAAPKLKDQGFSVSVSSGVATLTGATKNGGSKGSAAGIAKSCGAKQVANNIMVEKVAKTPASNTTHAAKPAVKH